MNFILLPKNCLVVFIQHSISVLTQKMNNFIANPFSINEMFKTICRMYKIEDISYRTLKIQLENPTSRIWLNTFLTFYGLSGTVRMMLASYYNYYGYWSWIDTNVRITIDMFQISHYPLICFVLLNIYSNWEFLLFLCINKSINGDYMHEIVVDNVEDFKANNKDLFNPRYPFLTWIFQLLKKDGHTENCFTIGLRKWKKIHFKREFQYLPLLSPKIRILMLTFVSLCEIIGITFRILFGKLLKVTILQLFAKPYTVQMLDFSVYNVHLLCYSNRKMYFSRDLYYNDCKLWC